MKVYPPELRTRIVRAVEGGGARAESARRCAVSPRTIRRSLAQQRQTGALTPGRSSGRPALSGRHEAARRRAQVAAAHDVAKRAAWWAEATGLDRTQLIFVDARGTHLAMTPRSGRAPQGKRVVGAVPRNHDPNTTVCAALSVDGVTAAMTLEGAVDRLACAVFVATSAPQPSA